MPYRIHTGAAKLFGLGQIVFAAETLHPAGCIQKFLLAGKIGMAIRADFNAYTLFGRARGILGAAGTVNQYFVIFRMNSRSHFISPQFFLSRVTLTTITSLGSRTCYKGELI